MPGAGSGEREAGSRRNLLIHIGIVPVLSVRRKSVRKCPRRHFVGNDKVRFLHNDGKLDPGEKDCPIHELGVLFIKLTIELIHDLRSMSSGYLTNGNMGIRTLELAHVSSVIEVQLVELGVEYVGVGNMNPGGVEWVGNSAILRVRPIREVACRKSASRTLQ